MSQALPLANDTPVVVFEASSTTEAPEPVISEIAVEIPFVEITAPTPTTETTESPASTETPPNIEAIPTVLEVPAVEPVIVVECATNPPHGSVSFGDVEAELDWSITTSLHPGGTGLPSVTNEWGSGVQTPVQPVIVELPPNTIRITASTTSPTGETRETSASIERFTGCPTPNSWAGFQADSIDCVTGAFVFASFESDGEFLIDGEPFDRSFVVDSVVVERWNGPTNELHVNEGGNYWVPDWNGAEEVKAVVTFTAADGTHEKHINHFCHDGAGFQIGPNYQVCSDERLHIAYPENLVSNIEIEGAEGNSCSVFQGESDTGDFTSDHVTISSLGEMTLDEAEASFTVDRFELVDVVDADTYSNPPSGLRRDVERRGYELSHVVDDETIVYSKVWLIDLDGEILVVQSDFHGLEVIDSMVATLQFIIQ